MRGQRSADKRWDWVRRGAPIIVEIGPRDAAAGQVTFMRRDRLRDGEKIASQSMPRDAFVAQAPAMLAEMQAGLFAEAKAMLDGNISSDIRTFDELAEYFGPATDDDEDVGGAFSRAGSAPPGRAPPARRWTRSRRG